jgi:hypothetical protein
LTGTALERVLWLGGMSGVGKTTAARLFAHCHDLRLYSLDARTYEHANRLPPEPRPLEEIWIDMTPTALADWFEEKARERFPLVVEDLLTVQDEAPIVAEGPQLLPELVAPLLASPDNALYVVAPPAIQQPLVRARVSDLAARTRNPEHARTNRLARDEELARRLRVSAAAYRVPIIEVADVTETLPAVERHFGPSLAAWLAAPHGDVAARRRDENDARLRQWRAHVDAMEIEPSGEVDLACECETPGCELPATIGLLAAESLRVRGEPLLAH